MLEPRLPRRLPVSTPTASLTKRNQWTSLLTQWCVELAGASDFLRSLIDKLPNKVDDSQTIIVDDEEEGGASASNGSQATNGAAEGSSEAMVRRKSFF